MMIASAMKGVVRQRLREGRLFRRNARSFAATDPSKTEIRLVRTHPADEPSGSRAAWRDARAGEDVRAGEGLQDVFKSFPQHDTLAFSLHLSPSRPLEASTSSPCPSRDDLIEDATVPSPLRGVPLLEDLFRENRTGSFANDGLIRILSHESVLYRGVMERKRRVSRLSKYSDRCRRLGLEEVNRSWILELGRLLRHADFTFAPEQFQSFRLDSGKRVKLAVPSPRDEIILDSMRLVLDAICEPRFSEYSFGFRPDRGRQIALHSLRNHIKGMDYYIVIDLARALEQFRGFQFSKAVCRYFQDPAFERLLFKAVDVGYVNTHGMKSQSFVQVPKEAGISPLLVNCFLDRLDKWLEAGWTADSGRVLRFVRCGAALFIGTRGTSSEAQNVVTDIVAQLQKLQLDVSLAQITVHHACDHQRANQRARFLGYEISREDIPSQMPSSLAQQARRTARPVLHIPTIDLRSEFLENGFIKMSKMNTWIPFGNGFITHWPVEHIVRYFDRLTVGLLEFYATADNFQQLNWFVYILKRSCNLTIGRKLKLRSMRKVFTKYGRDLVVKDGDTVVATIPDRSLSVRPVIRDFHPELAPNLRRRRHITRGTRPETDALDTL